MKSYLIVSKAIRAVKTGSDVETEINPTSQALLNLCALYYLICYPPTIPSSSLSYPHYLTLLVAKKRSVYDQYGKEGLTGGMGGRAEGKPVVL